MLDFKKTGTNQEISNHIGSTFQLCWLSHIVSIIFQLRNLLAAITVKGHHQHNILLCHLLHLPICVFGQPGHGPPSMRKSVYCYLRLKYLLHNHSGLDLCVSQKLPIALTCVSCVAQDDSVATYTNRKKRTRNPQSPKPPNKQSDYKPRTKRTAQLGGASNLCDSRTR